MWWNYNIWLQTLSKNYKGLLKFCPRIGDFVKKICPGGGLFEQKILKEFR